MKNQDLMTATATAMNDMTSQLLDRFGLAIGVAGAHITDFDLAGQRGYIHHAQIPIAVTGYAVVAPALARGRFPEYTFINLIHTRPSMDEQDATALAALCGVNVTPPFWGNPEPFANHLWRVIESYDLWAFFERTDDPHVTSPHYLMRPRGAVACERDQADAQDAISRWRKEYRALPVAKQLMVATILNLYLMRDDTIWMVRVPKKWHAAEGIEALQAAGYLTDWAKLVALYPGW